MRLMLEPERAHASRRRRTAALGSDMLLGASVYSVQDKIRIRVFVRDMARISRVPADRRRSRADRRRGVLLSRRPKSTGTWSWRIPAGEVAPVRLGGSGAARLDELDGAELVRRPTTIRTRRALPSRRALRAGAERSASASAKSRGTAMADISLEAVTGKLNRVGYEAFIQALRQAKSAGNRNVELAHWLLHILQKDRTDLALTADHFKLDRAKLLADVDARGRRLPQERDRDARRLQRASSTCSTAAGTTRRCSSARRRSAPATCWSRR